MLSSGNKNVAKFDGSQWNNLKVIDHTLKFGVFKAILNTFKRVSFSKKCKLIFPLGFQMS